MELKKKRMIMSFGGIVLTAVSVGFLRFADFGVDPYCVLLTGLGRIFHMSFTVISTVICILLLAFAWKMKKSLVGISTILNLFFYGIIADGVYMGLKACPLPDILGVRIFFLVLALFVLTFSAALYYTADLGVSTYDAIALIMADRKIGQFRYCRIGIDMICIVGGFLAGGQIGIATVIIAFCVGPFIQFFRTNVTDPMMQDKDCRKMSNYVGGFIP